MYGRTYAQAVCWRAVGAMIAATMRRAAVASQMGRNRAETTALATSDRPDAATRRFVSGDDEGLAATRRQF
jgi:hypothetical protein